MLSCRLGCPSGRWDLSCLILLLVYLVERKAALPIRLDFDDEDILDLTYPFNNQTVYYPSMEQLGFTFKLGSITRRMNKQGQFYSAYQFEASEHGGTHVDAPSHNQINGSSVDQIPLSQIIGPAVVLDISQKVQHSTDYEVSVEDIQQWEDLYGKIPKRAILILYSGAGKKWPNRNALFGTRHFPEDSKFHFPGLSPHAAKWLLSHRALKAVGTDGPSVDSGTNQRHLPVHQLFSRNNVAIIEFIANVEQLPPVGATVIGLPMKIQGGSGAPLRLIAVNWRRDRRELDSDDYKRERRKNTSTIPPTTSPPNNAVTQSSPVKKSTKAAKFSEQNGAHSCFSFFASNLLVGFSILLLY